MSASHISTQQWQSFEMRMRHRRAERCVLRAEVALEAGFEEDARQALAEARKLDWNAPEFEAVRAAVCERLLAEAAAERAVRLTKLRRMAVAATLAVATLGGGAAMILRDPASPETVTAATAPAPVSGPAAAPVSSVAGAPATPALTSPPATAAKKRDARVAPALAAPNPLPKVAQLPKTRPLPAVKPSPLASAPGATASIAAPPAPEDDAGAEADEARRVRSVLAGYEAAYGKLTAAFAGADIQRVSLGQCALVVDGAIARADCDGSLTARAGGASRTDPRHWKFELKNTGGTWQIVSAQAR